MSAALNNSPAEIMRAILLAPSDALFSDPDDDASWPLYVSAMTDGTGTPNNMAAVYDTDGLIHARLLSSGRNLMSYGIQLKTCSLDYSLGFIRLSKAAEYLAKVKRTTVQVSSNSYVVDTIIQTSLVMSAGQDEKRRAFSTVNFLLMLIESV